MHNVQELTSCIHDSGNLLVLKPVLVVEQPALVRVDMQIVKIFLFVMQCADTLCRKLSPEISAESANKVEISTSEVPKVAVAHAQPPAHVKETQIRQFT